MRSTCCAASTAATARTPVPTEAIVLGDNYELSFTNRREAIYDKDMLLEPVRPGAQTTPQKTTPGEFTRSVPEMKNPSD